MFLLPDSIQSLAIDIAVVSATVLLLKQWLRKDVERVEARVLSMEQEQEELRESHESAVKELDLKAHASISRLAETVEVYVREATNERFRKTETDAVRDRNFESRLVGLEITTGNITKSLDRIMESVDILLRRDAS